MYDLRRFFPAQYLACRALVCGLGLAAFSLTASAEIALDPAYDKFRATLTGNSVSVQYGGLAGSPLATSSNIKAIGAPGAVTASKGATIATKYGRVGFTAAQRFSALALARGVASVAGGPLAVGLIAAPAIYDWLTDSGVGIDPATGQAREQTAGQIVCSMATPGGVPRPGYIWHANTGNAVGQWCGEGLEGYPNFVSAQGTIVSVGAPGLGDPLTDQELTDMLTEHARASEDLEAILQQLRQVDPAQAQPEAADTPTLTPGTDSPTLRKTESTTQPDGTVDTTTRDCKAVSKSVLGSPSSLKIVEECTVTKTSIPPAGSPTTTTTSTSSDEAAQVDPATEAAEDKGFCETLIGKLLCADLDTPQAEPIDKTTKTLTYATENHFGGGACPADQVMTTHNGQSLKVWDWATSCDKINQFFRPLFLTLCAFTALMILAPAVKEA